MKLKCGELYSVIGGKACVDTNNIQNNVDIKHNIDVLVTMLIKYTSFLGPLSVDVYTLINLEMNR